MLPGHRELGCWILAGILAFASSAGAGENEATSRSAALYLRVCSACHGENGNGKSLANTALKTSPRDFTTEEARTSLSREYMIAIVRDGRPHTAMVGRSARLAQGEIEGVVDFIRTAFMPPEPGTARAQGLALYRKSCAACHGDRGQGGTARAGSPPAPPLSASRVRAGLGDDAMVEAILRERHAPGMPVSGPGFTMAQTRSIVVYVRTSFIEAGARRRGKATP